MYFYIYVLLDLTWELLCQIPIDLDFDINIQQWENNSLMDVLNEMIKIQENKDELYKG